ncbi:MAG TPA: TA system VapC family ribonuclease toxin [Nakamurella sp.]
MKIVDANVLLYSVNRQARQHQRATEWLNGALSSAESVGLPWVSLLAFLRVATNPRIFERALSAEQAFDVMETWLGRRQVTTLAPTARHLSIFRGLVETHGAAGNLTTDAHLAALALEHGAEIVTFDRDFVRFGVKLELLA